MTQATYINPDALDRNLVSTIFAPKRASGPTITARFYILSNTHSASAAYGYDSEGMIIQTGHWNSQKFHKLASQWKKERGLLSSATKMSQHPAYQEIIKMGMRAVPFLLAELEREPDHWFLALYSIVGVNPISEASRGKVREMAQDWINWGQARGYSWDNI